jgi:hypothetical protein
MTRTTTEEPAIMLSRRSFAAGLFAALAAPAIIRTPGLLMPVKPVLIPPPAFVREPFTDPIRPPIGSLAEREWVQGLRTAEAPIAASITAARVRTPVLAAFEEKEAATAAYLRAVTDLHKEIRYQRYSILQNPERQQALKEHVEQKRRAENEATARYHDLVATGLRSLA